MPHSARRTRPLLAVLALAWGVAQAQPLTLDEAMRLATRNSPQLAAQRAAAEAATAMVGPASQNPDPKLVVGVENVPTSGADKWSLTADGMTMRRVGVMQDFVRGDKLDARVEKARAEAAREAAMLEVQELEVRREVAAAWLERHYAARNRALVEEQIREALLQIDASRASLAAGSAGSAEALAARGLKATLEDKRLDMQRMERRATVMLARWLGEDAQREPGAAPDVTRLPRDVRALVHDIEGHPELTQYEPLIAAAEAEVKLAAAATQPDWSVELSYGVRGAAYTDMVSLMFRTELPLLSGRRQDPMAEAKRRQLAQVRAQAEEGRRKHAAEIRGALQDWEAARERLGRHRDEIVPLAIERERAVAAAYQGGRAELAMVLEARRMVLEARMNAVAVEAELARAWAQLAYLIP